MHNILSLPRRLGAGLRRFLSREEGSVIAEAVIVLPVLIWAYVGLFVYWDLFRALNTVQKATYTVADLISREQTGIQSDYITGMHKVLDYLINDKEALSVMRVTSITWSDANQRFQVHWSRSTDGVSMPPLTTDTLQDYVNQIPTMSPGDYVVIVEVKMPYQPLFDVGLPQETFSEFIVTRPRFLPCIPMDNISCPVS